MCCRSRSLRTSRFLSVHERNVLIPRPPAVSAERRATFEPDWPPVVPLIHRWTPYQPVCEPGAGTAPRPGMVHDRDTSSPSSRTPRRRSSLRSLSRFVDVVPRERPRPSHPCRPPGRHEAVASRVPPHREASERILDQRVGGRGDVRLRAPSDAGDKHLVQPRGLGDITGRPPHDCKGLEPPLRPQGGHSDVASAHQTFALLVLAIRSPAGSAVTSMLRVARPVRAMLMCRRALPAASLITDDSRHVSSTRSSSK